IKDATAAAQKWQSDAVLTHIATAMGFADGTADHWLYTFYSPKAKKSAIVTARAKKVEIEPDVRNSSIDPVGSDFIDSDKTAEAAVKGGLKLAKGSKEVLYGMTVGNQAVGKPQLFWTVTTMSADRATGVVLNGKDGAFIRRDELKFK
ncbi:MAG TPA: hypothetical protein VGD18_00705, partial [Thiobacillaceae bacterium]